MHLKTSLDIRLIMISIHQLSLIPLPKHIQNAFCFSYNLRCQSECHTCQIYLAIVKMEHKKSGKLMVVFDSFHHLTKLIARLMFQACYSKRASQQLSKCSGILLDMFSSLVRSPWCMNFFGRITYYFLIFVIRWILLHVFHLMMGTMNEGLGCCL